MHFEWDDEKAKANLEKHAVGFEEARSVFFEESALLYDDPDPSHGEQRFLLVGPSDAMRLLVVVHCCRLDDVIRIISARRTTKRERTAYVAARSG